MCGWSNWTCGKRGSANREFKRGRSTGNAAFDQHLDAELERLAAEREELARREQEFQEFREARRLAEDQAAFDRFKAESRANEAG